MISIVAWVVTAAERESFKRCRRAWDWGARTRRGLEPIASQGEDRSFRDALAVHYFPGMWAWDRNIVRALVRKAAGGTVRHVEHYLDWAAEIDEFEPLRVECDFDAHIPDPREVGRDLATPWGEAVHYRGRINALVVDAHDANWLLVHRFGRWSNGDALQLDESVVAAAWAWQHQHLDVAIRGVLFNEIDAERRFRRSVRRLSPLEIDDAGEQLGWEAIDMIDSRLSVYPTPAAHCAACPFVMPCVVMTEHGDAEAVLADAYRPRPPDDPAEDGLGGSTWSMGRGAAPPRFGGR